MKKVVQVTEVDGEGLVGLLGKRVLIFCMNYIYTGELEGVNQSCILLKDASIVYDTGAHDAKSFADAQKIGSWYVQSNSIESFGETSKK